VAPEPASAAYERWFLATFGTYGTAPNTHPATSWHPGTRWGGRMLEAMSKPEGEYAESLLAEIAEKNIPGAIVEFGVFDGDWMERLITSCETIGLQREVWGFDSFEGLPPPSPTEDLDCWAEGDFAASLESVAERLGTAYRPHVKLVKGWFSDTLPTAAVQGITQIAYARIDCDLYGPSVECLDYLTTRLSDQAILVLDDWTYNLAKGETMSFMQWAERNQQFRFEFLCFNSVGHFYVRVHRR